MEYKLHKNKNFSFFHFSALSSGPQLIVGALKIYVEWMNGWSPLIDGGLSLWHFLGLKPMGFFFFILPSAYKIKSPMSNYPYLLIPMKCLKDNVPLYYQR